MPLNSVYLSNSGVRTNYNKDRLLENEAAEWLQKGRVEGKALESTLAERLNSPLLRKRRHQRL